MQWIKNKFIRLDLYRQIKYGVVSVSVCVCSLIFLTLLIVGYMLTQHSYIDTLALVNIHENEQMEGIANFINTLLKSKLEQDKNNIQYIRNLIENFKAKPHFYTGFSIPENSLIYSVANPRVHSDCINGQQCFIFKRQNIANKTEKYLSDLAFEKLYKAIYFAKPMIESIYNSHYNISYANTSLDVFKPDFHYYSNEAKTYFYFPFSRPNTTDTSYYAFLNQFDLASSQSIKDLVEYLLVGSLNSYITSERNLTTLQVTSTMNPYIINLTRNGLSNFLNKKIPFIRISKVIGVSCLFNDDFTLSDKEVTIDLEFREKNQILSIDKVKDIMFMNLEKVLIDIQNRVNSHALFRGINIMFSNVGDDEINQEVLSNSICLYFMLLNSFYENFGDLGVKNSNLTSKHISNLFTKTKLKDIDTYNYPNSSILYGDDDYNIRNLSNCFNFNEKARKYISEYFINDSKYSDMERSLKRKIISPVIKKPGETVDKNDYRYKILKAKVPFTEKGFVQYKFTPDVNIIAYIFKSLRFYDEFSGIIGVKFDSILILILGSNFAIWYCILLIIIILLFKVTSDLTTPIKNLITKITKMGQNDYEAEEIEKDNVEKNSTKTSSSYSVSTASSQIKINGKIEDKSELNNEEKTTILYKGKQQGDDYSHSPASSIQIGDKMADECISYPDDDEINELFQICNNLIKGGYQDNGISSKKNNNFYNAMNNTSVIKTNNMIINEDKIERFTNNRASSLFNYKKNVLLSNNENEDKLKNNHLNFGYFFAGEEKIVSILNDFFERNPNIDNNRLYKLIKPSDFTPKPSVGLPSKTSSQFSF